MIRQYLVVFLALVFALVACGDDASSVADAGRDAPPPHPIVGRWSRSDFNGGTTVVVFEANGVYRDGSTVGSWRFESGELALPLGTAPFYLSEDKNTLMTTAMLPTTPTSGLIGTWVGGFTYPSGLRQDTTFIFRDDGTLTWTDVRPSGTRSDEGTWRLQDDKIFIEAVLNGQTPVNVGARLIPDVVVGEAVHTRLE